MFLFEVLNLPTTKRSLIMWTMIQEKLKNKLQGKLKDHVVAPILFSAVLILLGIVFGKLKKGSYTPLSIENPFVLISAIACGLVYLAFSVLLLLWMYERPEYMILKGVYYILCNLAFDSLLVVLLFTTT
ncbi:hypothetical protein Hdeb2414_s0001g00023931 [Helianthus debilis subsp. tardiflorus]